MRESFHQDAVGEVVKATRSGGSTRYQFRQPQTRINPLALRRLQLQEVESQRRQEIDAGNQELNAVKQMTRLEQQEYVIRRGIDKEKQVASAQREVAKLDPVGDPGYQQKYAEVMSRHPLAQDNKFLNEAFTDGTRVNYRAAQHNFNELEEGQKQIGKEELEWIKVAGQGAASGLDPAPYTNADGVHDWSGYLSAKAKAAQATKVAADAANAGLPISKTVTKEGDTTVTREAAKPAKPELTTAQKIEVAKLEGTHSGQIRQRALFSNQMNDPAAPPDQKAQAKKNLDAVTANLALSEAQMEAVHQAVTPPAPITNLPATTPVGGGTLTPAPVTTPPAATPAPAATLVSAASPTPTPAATPVPKSAAVAAPQAAIDYLKANPQFAPHFDQKYGENASTEHLTE